MSHPEIPRKVFLKNLNLVNIAMLKSGFSIKELHTTFLHSIRQRNNPRTVGIQRRNSSKLLPFFLYVLIPILLFVLTPVLIRLIEFSMSIRCIFPNNYIIYEATRPVSDCSYCKNLMKPIILRNVTQKSFEPYAYSSQPIIIKNAVSDWPAVNFLNYSYLKDLYLKTPEAMNEDCQFLHFKSDLMSLKDVFEMSKAKVDGNPSWYVGWSNCNPEILLKLRKLYPSPLPFLPNEVEVPDTDYIFMGYEQGAIMHLNYMHRLMWQAQLRGNKTWIVSPSPECDLVCSTFSFFVESGDVVLLDTRLWYYGTYIARGDLSITIQSEYG